MTAALGGVLVYRWWAWSRRQRGSFSSGSLGAVIWRPGQFAGWLFTLAFTQPLWWQAILALVIWPYYLGVRLQ